MSPSMTITLDHTVTPLVEARGHDPQTVVGTDLRRYYEALRQARVRLRETLEAPEISLMLDALNGSWLREPWSVTAVSIEIADAIRLDHLDEKWGVEAPAALVTTLEQLEYIDACALVDAVERWWQRVAHGETELDPATALDEPEEEP